MESRAPGYNFGNPKQVYVFDSLNIATIEKAPNYMKYSTLSELAYEAWVYGRNYYETY